jgi:hypothetical protein
MQNCAWSGSVFWQDGQVRAMLDIPPIDGKAGAETPYNRTGLKNMEWRVEE